ncbi:MAG TPA: hypothetical protein VJ974_04140 [Geopsychrobacteraceae bacterium]|nr:hypothetical protein [Geopsychrobacteraceae bacterium]
MMNSKGSNIKVRHGLSMLVLLFLVFLSYDIGRHTLVTQGVPTFFVEKTPEIQIDLNLGNERMGVLQITDALSMSDVRKMTNIKDGSLLWSFLSECKPLRSGEAYKLQVVSGEVRGCSRGWMSSAQRVSLGIPLHPDRMSEADWDYLPGVGAGLSGAIEANRQINGDYLDLDSLARVKGIGKGRIDSWRNFFNRGNLLKNKDKISIGR